MTNVVDLDNRRPHAHGLIQCGRCEYRWVGVWPVGLWWLHCPRCDGAVNMHGTPVQVGVCKFCGRPFTVCPEPDEPYDECLAEDCASYDPSRDADKIFHLAVSRPVGEEQ